MGIALKRDTKYLNNFKEKYETKQENEYLFTEILIKHEGNETLEYLETLHEHENNGYISILNKKESFMKHFPYDELEIAIQKYKAFEGQKDIYISQNTFFKKNNSGKYLKQFRALYADLDVEKKGLSKEEVLKTVEHKIIIGDIPKPTLIIDSGRGFHLIWCIQNIPNNSHSVWQYTEDLLLKSLEKLGLDKSVKDSSRVLRLPGTINSKNDAICKIITNTKRIYFIDNLLNVLKKKQKKSYKKTQKKNNNTKNKIINLFTPYSLHFQRRNDLVKLCELRSWKLEGHRELILFLFRYWSCVYDKNPDIALRKTLEFNLKFKNPLDHSEVIHSTKSSENYFESYEESKYSDKNKKKLTFRDKNYKGLNISNIAIINMLNITLEEQTHLSTIISKEEKNKRSREKKTPRNKNGLTKKQQELEDLKKKSLALKNKGLNNSQIAKSLKVDRKKISRLLN